MKMTKKELRRAIYNKYNGHCSYCGKEIEFKDMQVDHKEAKATIKPIGKGLDGTYIYPDIDNFDNLMPSCRRCNHYKRAETLENYRRRINTVHERIQQNYIAKVALDYGIIVYTKWDGIFYFERT
jgi:5-methylcytosine-specific restriction endonuclease McrA